MFCKPRVKALTYELQIIKSGKVTRIHLINMTMNVWLEILVTNYMFAIAEVV